METYHALQHTLQQQQRQQHHHHPAVLKGNEVQACPRGGTDRSSMPLLLVTDPFLTDAEWNLTILSFLSVFVSSRLNDQHTHCWAGSGVHAPSHGRARGPSAAIARRCCPCSAAKRCSWPCPVPHHMAPRRNTLPPQLMYHCKYKDSSSIHTQSTLSVCTVSTSLSHKTGGIYSLAFYINRSHFCRWRVVAK